MDRAGLYSANDVGEGLAAALAGDAPAWPAEPTTYKPDTVFKAWERRRLSSTTNQLLIRCGPRWRPTSRAASKTALRSGRAAARGGWRHHAAEQARLRRVADVAMRRIRNSKLGAAFERWARCRQSS